MPKSFSDLFNLDSNLLKKMGVFDPILDIDSKLFIDPHLLQFTQAPELGDSYSKIRQRFNNVLQVMKYSKEKNDVFWRKAYSLLSFSEIGGFCIGYSTNGTSGSGIGGKLRNQLIEVSKQIIDAGIADPEIFELVGLFEDNIGADRISDMTAPIIAEDVFLYTERIFRDLSLPTSDYNFRGRVYKISMNPYRHFPIILMPRDILLDLPIAECWDDIDIVCKFNDQLRQRVNHIIGNTWKQATGTKKSILKKVLLQEPEILRDLITLYKQKAPIQYDFISDRAGQVVWYPASQRSVKENPLELMLPQSPTAEDVLAVVLKICRKFKDLIENNALCSLLYVSLGKPKREEAAQKLFYGIADCYCESNNIDLSRETNGGRGPVDFKLSTGYKAKVVVEAKLTTNSQLIHGFDTQIIEYQKAEKTDYGVYLVIDVGGSRQKIETLKKKIDSYKASDYRVPDVVFVDAIPKLSASKYEAV